MMLANDRINDLTTLFCTPGAPEPSAVLGCQDRAVRVLEGSEVRFEGVVDGPVLTVCGFASAAAPAQSALSQFNSLATEAAPARATRRPGEPPAAELLYGTENGIVGQLLLGADAMRRGWELGGRSVAALGAPGRAGARRGGVTELCAHDLTRDGVPDVIVGRDDGTLQVFSFDVSAEPKLCFEASLTGSITGVAAGLVSSAQFDEIVVSTYSGQVLSFSSQPSGQIDLTGDDGRGGADDDDGDDGGSGKGGGGLKAMLSRQALKQPSEPKAALASRQPGDGQAIAAVAAAAVGQEAKKGALRKRVGAVRREIEALQAKLEAERQRYGSTVSSEMIAVQADARMRTSFALSEEEACYRLTVELSKPLDYVLLQSDVPMEALDTIRAEAGEDQAAQADELSSAIVSRTHVGQSNLLLATYRVADGATRLAIRLRTIEGRYGNLSAYVVPMGQPKTAQAVSFQIRPLSLHRRLPALPESAAARPMSELRLSGSFSLAELHAWVRLTLPEVPERVAADEVSLFFTSTFLGTFLSCAYRRGDALFRSDNLTTLTTIREVASREATQRKVQLRTAYEVNDESVSAMLRLLHPMLAHQNALAHRVRPRARPAWTASARLGSAGMVSCDAPRAARPLNRPSMPPSARPQVRLIDTLKELEQQEGTADFLDPEYVAILANAATIRSEFAQMPRQLDYLVGIAVDLYADKYKLKGVNVQGRLPQLDRLLRTEYSLDAMLEFFRDA